MAAEADTIRGAYVGLAELEAQRAGRYASLVTGMDRSAHPVPVVSPGTVPAPVATPPAPAAGTTTGG